MENNQETLETYKRIQKRDRIQKIILIIIIIILLLLCIVVYRVGKIGYSEHIVPTPGMESVSLIKVTAGDMEIKKDSQLDIFKNAKFDYKNIIAPKSKGEYTFCVKNTTDKNISYNIKFEEEMQYHINMKYKLKIDNVYIRGSENEYVDIEELSVEDIVGTKESINMYTLEWYWEDDDKNDTIVGRQNIDQEYTLHLEIYANELN
ncbi:MAG: hypothetical protein IKL68_05525 [Clostridia bacterium]|nr:hypothetical protein [Clostridia bacterium]